jgi:hypothetical protein
MPDFLFNNNLLQTKFISQLTKSNIIPPVIPQVIQPVIKKIKGSLIATNVSKKIYKCFTNNIPLKLKNGLTISYKDCNTYKEAIIKHASIISKIKSQTKKIKINGHVNKPQTNESFIRTIDAEFGNHFDSYCIINNINGKYNSNFVSF